MIPVHAYCGTKAATVLDRGRKPWRCNECGMDLAWSEVVWREREGIDLDSHLEVWGHKACGRAVVADPDAGGMGWRCPEHGPVPWRSCDWVQREAS